MLRRNNKKEASTSRTDMLAARPLRHPQAEETPRDNGALELAVPVRQRRIARWLKRNDKPIIRRFELDHLGADVWRMLDGRNTVRAIIETFAREYQLNLREAEVSILAYLRMLAGRGMMVLAVEKTPQEGTDTRGRS